MVKNDKHTARDTVEAAKPTAISNVYHHEHPLGDHFLATMATQMRLLDKSITIGHEERLLRTLAVQKGQQPQLIGIMEGAKAEQLFHRGRDVKYSDVLVAYSFATKDGVSSPGLKDVTIERILDDDHSQSGADVFDAIIVVQSFRHCTDAKQTFADLLRLLKPGGKLIIDDLAIPPNVVMTTNEVVQMRSLQTQGFFKLWHSRRQYLDLYTDGGCVEVKEDDYTAEVMPFLTVLFAAAYLPYLVLSLFGLINHFPKLRALVILWKTAPAWSLHTFSGTKRVNDAPLSRLEQYARVDRRDLDPASQTFDESETALGVKALYDLKETRAGYRFVLDNARHFGYYEKATDWPFPVAPRLREMERRLKASLDLPPDSKVLDVACGAGVVAQYMVEHGFRMQCMDLVDHHVEKARRRITAHGLEERMHVQQGNYHSLPFDNESFDGVYDIEAIVHSPNPRKVFAEMFRVLRPGGHLAMHEYESHGKAHLNLRLWEYAEAYNRKAAMPALEIFEHGVIERMLMGIGFVDVRVLNHSENIIPNLRYWYWLAVVPYYIVRLLGLRRFFPNAEGAVESDRWWGFIGYAVITARKPEAVT